MSMEADHISESNRSETGKLPDNGGGPTVTEDPILEYNCHPARRNMTITVLTTIFIIVCLILVWMISYSLILTALGALILFGSLSGFYFSTQYSFYSDHFIVKTTMQALKKEYKLYRSFYPDKNGVLLSPFGHRTRLENFRGLYIKFAGNREEVMTVIRSKIDFEEGS